MKPSFIQTLAALAASAIAAPACTEANATATNCVNLTLDRPMLVLESDLSTSSAIARLDTNGCFHETADVALGADPTLSLAAGRPFVNVRDQGVVVELDPQTTKIVRSIPALRDGDPQPNPWDVGVDASGRVWIARYNLASAAVIAPDGAWSGVVDLSSLADADGVPEMESVTISKGRAFIAVERLLAKDGFPVATGPGLLAVATTEPPFALQAPIQLEGSNPFGRLVPVLSDPSGDTVTIVTPGNIDAIDGAGGVEQIRLSTGEHKVIAAEADLGGSPVEAVVASETEGYAIVSGPIPGTNPTSIVRFDPSTGKVTRSLAGPASSYAHWGLAINGPYLFAGDRTYGDAALHAYDRDTGEEKAVVRPDVLPPVSVVTVDR